MIKNHILHFYNFYFILPRYRFILLRYRCCCARRRICRAAAYPLQRYAKMQYPRAFPLCMCTKRVDARNPAAPRRPQSPEAVRLKGRISKNGSFFR
jgi:hypothetical protein